MAKNLVEPANPKQCLVQKALSQKKMRHKLHILALLRWSANHLANSRKE